MILRILMVVAVALGCSLQAWAQGSVRRADSLAQMLAINPFSTGTSGKLSVEVSGQTAERQYPNPRTADWYPTAQYPTNRGNVFNSPFTGQWVFRDREDAVQDVRNWGMFNDDLDDSDAWEDLVSFTNSVVCPAISGPPSTLRFSRPIKFGHNYPLMIYGQSGGYSSGWFATNLESQFRLLYTGPPTNIFVDLMPTVGLRVGINMRGVTIDADGKADVAIRFKNLTRGDIVDVLPRNSREVGALVENTVYVNFQNLSISANERPFTYGPKIGLLLTNQANANNFIGTAISGTTNWGIVIADRSQANKIINGGVENNRGGGVWLQSGVAHNEIDGVWFEQNDNTNRFIQIDSSAFLNEVRHIRFENRIGKAYIDGAYTRIEQCLFGRLEFGPNAGNCDVRNVFLEVGQNIEGYLHFQNLMNVIDAAEAIRTNVIQNVQSFRGSYIELLRDAEEYPRTTLTRSGIYFGAGDTNQPDAGWTRVSGNSLATSNAVLFLRRGANDGLFSAYVDGDAQPRVSLNVNSTLAMGPGGSTAPDTYWKRNGIGNWLTEAQTWVLRPLTNDTAFAALRTGNAHLPFVIRADGKHEFGSGAVARDASIERTGVGEITIRTNVVFPGTITIGGSTYSDWPVKSVFGRTGNVVSQSGDYDSSQISNLSEAIDDRIATTIVGGTDISVSYNDAGDSLTISYTGSGGGGGGGTNSLSVDGVAVTNPNLQDGDIQFTAAGTNITATVNTSAITYAKIQNVAAERILGRQSGSSGAPQELTAGDGLVISGTDLKLDIAAGSNVSLATNGSGAITFNVSVPAGTNGWQIGVDGSIVASPNLADATGIQVTASGTNITYALADRDWGDISSSASGLTLSIDSGAVTYAKIQNLSSTNLLLGRGSASGGAPQEISIGSGLSMSGTTLVATGTNAPVLTVNGTVVANGNIKDSTDLTWVVQSATNVVGAINAGSVTFNKIQNISQNQIIGRYSSGAGEPQGITVGPAFNLLSGTIGITNSDKGDITTSGEGSSWVIDSAAVTYAKIQDVTSTNVVLGFGAGASPGDVKELSVGTGLITTPTTITANLEAGTNVVLTTNGTRIKISSPNSAITLANDNVANLLLVTDSEVTDINQDSTWRDVTPSARSGMSAIVPGGTILSGAVLKVEIIGEMTTRSTTGDFSPELRLVFDGPTGSDYTISWKMGEPGSVDPFLGTTWSCEAKIVVASASSSSTVRQRSYALYGGGDMNLFSGLSSFALHAPGEVSNPTSFDTTQDATVRLQYRAIDNNMDSFKVTSLVVWIL